jgi:hypothetical protein
VTHGDLLHQDVLVLRSIEARLEDSDQRRGEKSRDDDDDVEACAEPRDQVEECAARRPPLADHCGSVDRAAPAALDHH